MRNRLVRKGVGSAALALGFGAAIAAAAPAASADTGRADGPDAGQHQTRHDTAKRRGADRVAPAAARVSARNDVPVARTPAVAPKPAAVNIASRQVRTATPAPPATVVPEPAQVSPAPASVPVPAPAAVATPTAKAAAQPRLWLLPTALFPTALRSGSTGAAELSGITYAGGADYYAVGDNGATTIWQVAAKIGAGLGWLWSGAVTGGINAPGMGRDSEGVALRPGRGSVWVSDEIDSTITEFSLSTGAAVGSVAVPDIYRPANVQGNFGLESLSYGAGELWTANEEALRSDGSLSTTKSGSWVRIQRFTGEDVTATTQYAYKTDRITGMSPFISVERSGLVDLLALPDGRVLSLEREVGGFFPHFRSRIYQVDFSGATDVSTLPSLADGGFTAVNKRLLWQGTFLSDNFEGMTLGPRLNNGGYTVLLVSDDGSGESAQRQDLFNFVLYGVKDTPPVVV